MQLKQSELQFMSDFNITANNCTGSIIIRVLLNKSHIILFTPIGSWESGSLYQLTSEDNLSGVALQQQYTNEHSQEHCSPQNVTALDWWHGSLFLCCPSNFPSSLVYRCRLFLLEIPKDSSLRHWGLVILVARWEQLGGGWCYCQTFLAAHP